jgi:hypothetical protein
MDIKQIRIFDKLLEKYKLKSDKIVFIQHRNLKEFRYFKIERINPTHRIILYGSLKNSNKKKGTARELIKVGEILLSVTGIGLNLNILYIYSDFILLCLSMYIINVMFFYIFGNINLIGGLIKRLQELKVSWVMVKQYLQ